MEKSGSSVRVGMVHHWGSRGTEPGDAQGPADGRAGRGVKDGRHEWMH